MSSAEVSSEADVLSENDETDIKSFLKEADGNIKDLKMTLKDDEVSKYVNEYLEKEMYNGNGPIPNVDNSSSDDLETVIEDSKAEETFNFRFEEKGSDKIMTHPRKVAGEQREKMSARKRKRMEEKKKKEEDNERFNKEMDEVEEKWHKIYIENGNNFTSEQLSQYNSEVSDIILKYQGGAFQYVETTKQGGIEKSIKIMEEEDDEEEEFDDGVEEEDIQELNEKQKEKTVQKAEKLLKQIKKEDGEEESAEEDAEPEKEGEEKPEKKKHRGTRGKHRAGRGRDKDNRRRSFKNLRGGKGGRGGHSKPSNDRSSTYQMH